MEIPLDLGRHCIETAARITLERTIRAALKSPEPKMEEKINALTRFLQTQDFSSLRSQISSLSSAPAQCVLHFQGDELQNIGLGETTLPPAHGADIKK